ncbi:MAG: hypothetical protein FJ399_20535 [Verrucomicrobia bacterium]|nr:hypothetical protein [Verrucomicrobiota bacterium]
MRRAFWYVLRVFVRTRDCRVTVPALLFDPEFLVFDFVPDQGLTKFLVASEEILDQSPFIDIRFEPLAQAQFWVSTADLLALESRRDVPRPGPAFIFHHAFVCSTLLARCLGRSNAFFSLKEPWILRRLADVKRARSDAAPGPAWRELLCAYVNLLCRNFRTGRVPLIKATNVANNLLEDLLQFMPGQRVLYLYSDLESFLISVLRKSDDTKQKMPALAQSFLQDGNFVQRVPHLGKPAQMTPLQASAAVWLVSLYNLQRIASRHSRAALRTLDARDFMRDPPGTIAHVSRFFGHEPDTAEIERMTDRAVLEANAKDPPQPYSPGQRRIDMDATASRHRRELADMRDWIEPLAAELGVLDDLRALHLAA